MGGWAGGWKSLLTVLVVVGFPLFPPSLSFVISYLLFVHDIVESTHTQGESEALSKTYQRNSLEGVGRWVGGWMEEKTVCIAVL